MSHRPVMHLTVTFEPPGNDPSDVTIESREWRPTRKAFAAYQTREVELCKANRALLAKQEEPRHVAMVDNGCKTHEWEYRLPTRRLSDGELRRIAAYRGFASIGVVRGGPEHEDTLSSLITFGKAAP